jgi:hypothetical protein
MKTTAVRRPHRGHARPPPYRLDRRTRCDKDRIRPVASDGRGRRRTHTFVSKLALK